MNWSYNDKWVCICERYSHLGSMDPSIFIYLYVISTRHAVTHSVRWKMEIDIYIHIFDGFILAFSVFLILFNTGTGYI